MPAPKKNHVTPNRPKRKEKENTIQKEVVAPLFLGSLEEEEPDKSTEEGRCREGNYSNTKKHHWRRLPPLQEYSEAENRGE